MSTNPKPIAANPPNALVSAETKAPAGRKRSALNALKHGLRSSLFVVPGLEREEDWKRHLAAVVESVEPATYLEAVLAQDVALLTWRLGRVARAEREAVSLLQETAEDDWAKTSHFSSIEGLCEEVARKAQLIRDLEGFADLRAEDLGKGRAEAVLFIMADEVGDLDLTDPASFALPPPLTSENLEDGSFRDWTLELLHAVAEDVADVAEVTLADLVLQALERARRGRKRAEAALERAEKAVERLQRSRILPNEEDLERFSRYEAHLRRALAKTLGELRAMQAQRGSLTVIEAE